MGIKATGSDLYSYKTTLCRITILVALPKTCKPCGPKGGGGQCGKGKPKAAYVNQFMAVTGFTHKSHIILNGKNSYSELFGGFSSKKFCIIAK